MFTSVASCVGASSRISQLMEFVRDIVCQESGHNKKHKELIQNVVFPLHIVCLRVYLFGGWGVKSVIMQYF